MSEIEQLKTRIDEAGINGVENAHIRDDYEPVGDWMIRDLLASGKYVARRTPMHSFDSTWKIFKSGNEPY